MKRLWLLGIALALLLLASCGGGGGGGATLPPPNGGGGGGGGSVASITGYVYEYTPGQPSDPLLGAPQGYSPVPGATVTAGEKSTTTSQEGYFTIASVPVSVGTVLVSKAGYAGATRNVSLVANQTYSVSSKSTTSLLLNRTTVASLSVTSTPGGAEIALNGSSTGESTPRVFEEIPSGTYQVTVFLEGYNVGSKDVAVTSGTANVSFTLSPTAATPGGELDSPVSGGEFAAQSPPSMTGPSLPPPTPAERQALLQVDGGVVGEAVSTSGVKVYEDLLELLVEGYNDEIVPLSSFSSIPMVEAVYQSGKGSPVSGKIDVYYTGYDPSYPRPQERWNAFAGYETIFLYDNLFLSLDEAVSLLFLTENYDEWLYYQWLATQSGIAGGPFAVVPVELRDMLVADPVLGPIYSELACGAIAAVGLHEMGHVNLGHILQIQRLAATDELTAAVVTNTALNWPFEFQADIFAAHALDDSGAPTDGGIVFSLMIFTTELLDFRPVILRTHPPAVMRAFIFSEVGDGADLTGYLQPLLPDLKSFASISEVPKFHFLTEARLPILTPILGSSKKPSEAPELVAREPRVPHWFLDKYSRSR